MIKLEKKSVVIGTSLSALIYAFINESLIIPSKIQYPLEIDFIKSNINLDVYGIVCETRHLKGSFANESTDVGCQHIILWEKLWFFLNTFGYCIDHEQVNSLRLDTNRSELIVVNSLNKDYIVQFSKMAIFDELAEIRDLPFSIVPGRASKYRVCDYFSTLGFKAHEYDFFKDQEEQNFVREIYPVAKPGFGTRNIKDLVSVSYLTREEIMDVHHTHAIARIKTRNMMKNRELIGLSMRDNKRIRGQLTFIKRCVTLVDKPNNIYAKNNISYKNWSPEKLLKAKLHQDSTLYKRYAKLSEI